VKSAKAFDIPKTLVWDAYLDVKKRGGGPGVDWQSMEDFESDLKNHLYKIWNRLSSGSYFTVAMSNPLFLQKFGFLRMEIVGADLEAYKKLAPNIMERLYYWEYYSKNIVSGSKRVLFGHRKRPDRAKYPSAHNYYLDFVFNFGVLAILPLLGLIGYTVLMVYLGWEPILASSSLLGLTLVVFLLVLVDNSFKVGLRQPYPGILTFFLWGVLLSRLSESPVMARHSVAA
jgi:hypothetical protein